MAKCERCAKNNKNKEILPSQDLCRTLVWSAACGQSLVLGNAFGCLLQRGPDQTPPRSKTEHKVPLHYGRGAAERDGTGRAREFKQSPASLRGLRLVATLIVAAVLNTASA